MFQKSLGTTAPSHPVPYLTVSTLWFSFYLPSLFSHISHFWVKWGKPTVPWINFMVFLSPFFAYAGLSRYHPPSWYSTQILRWSSNGTFFTGPSLFSKPSATLLVSLRSGLYAVCMFINILALFLWLDLKCLQAWKHGLFTFAVFTSIKQKLTCSSQSWNELCILVWSKETPENLSWLIISSILGPTDPTGAPI